MINSRIEFSCYYSPKTTWKNDVVEIAGSGFVKDKIQIEREISPGKIGLDAYLVKKDDKEIVIVFPEHITAIPKYKEESNK